jgi:hypothetical protein
MILLIFIVPIVFGTNQTQDDTKAINEFCKVTREPGNTWFSIYENIIKHEISPFLLKSIEVQNHTKTNCCSNCSSCAYLYFDENFRRWLCV